MNINTLLTLTLKNRASDLHLSTGAAPAIRIDGDLHYLDYPSLDSQTIFNLLNDSMNMQQQKLVPAQHEIDFALTIANLGRFRVNLFQQHRGLAAVLRVIPSYIPSLEELALPMVIREFTQLTQGLVLITGATGSGKSTTLAAMLDAINSQQRKHIITIEDPIEFIHQNKHCLINQREIARDTLSFNHALRAALREDPDIILIGELRDLETIRLALTAAETGHLVLASLHTASATKTINRIIDVFPGDEKNLVRNLLSESLQAIVCQQLIKKTSGGRMAALEILRATPAIRNLIRENKTTQIYSVLQTNRNLGMQTLEQHLQMLTQ